MEELSFNISLEDSALIARIAARAVTLSPEVDKADLMMDIIACHASGMPLNLKGLLEASDFDFSHDVGGIGKHIDRDTGRLGGCFIPRFAVRQKRTNR